LGGALQAYQRSVQAFDDAVGRAMGIGQADLRCLDWLVGGACSAGELAAATGLRPAATTALIDRLVERGWVRRQPSAIDRRRVEVTLTAEGRRRIDQFYAPLVSQAPELVADLTVDQLVTTAHLLTRLTQFTDEHRHRLRPDEDSPQ